MDTLQLHFPDTLDFPLPSSPRALVQEGSFKDYSYILPIDSNILVDTASLPESLILDSGTFFRKYEFHLTILGFHTAELIKNYNDAHPHAHIIDSINSVLLSTDFSFTLLPDTLQLVTNLDYSAQAVRSHVGPKQFESEQTIIIAIACPGYNKFFASLQRLGIHIPSSSPHLTLYIKDNQDATGLGIAISDLHSQLRGETFPHISVMPLKVKAP